MSFTSGRDRTGLARIYDRLRKHSSRAVGAPMARMGRRAQYPPEEWVRLEHEAYTQGVSDALRAVAATKATS